MGPHAGAEINIPYPADQTCIVFVRRGKVEVLSGGGANDSSDNLKPSRLGPQDIALMKNDGSDQLRIRVKEADSSVLIMGGEPLNEPIAAHGPFVMNEQHEISRAIMDYQRGKFGR